MRLEDKTRLFSTIQNVYGLLICNRTANAPSNTIALAIGMFEFQISRLTKDYVHDFEQYVKEQFHKDMLGTKTLQMRTIPIGQSVTPEMRIEPYNDMKRYVGGLRDDISVSNCVCRQSAEVIGGSCRHSDIRETCLTFSDAARYSIGRGIGRGGVLCFEIEIRYPVPNLCLGLNTNHNDRW